MGTRTLGSTTAPSGATIQEQHSPGTQWRSGTTLTMPEEGYIDKIYVYCGSYDGGASTFYGALWNTSNTLIATTQSASYGTGYGWNAFSFPSTALFHIANGYQFYGGFWAGGHGSQIKNTYPSGHYYTQFNISGPQNFAGTADYYGYAGYMGWYITYYPVATASPNVWEATPGTTITITGRSFSAGVVSVTIGGVACGNVNVLSDTSLTCTVPANVPGGQGTLTVTTRAGSPSPGTFYVNPSYGSYSLSHATQGTVLYIYGSGFNAITAVDFNGTGASTWTRDSDTQIHVTIPAGATSGAIGITTVLRRFTFPSFTIDPYYSSMNPTHGSTGTDVYLAGSGFLGVTGVWFNGVSAWYNKDSDTQIHTQVPSGATTGTIRITNGTVDVYTGTFTIDTSIAGFNPTSGGVGTPVTITGRGFTGTTAVTFNYTTASYSVVNDTTINTTVPTGATTGRIRVTAPGGTATSSADFTIAGARYKAGGTLHQAKGLYIKVGGTLHPLKGVYIKANGTIHPTK